MVFCKHINALILLRFIQGIGGALNVPVARMIILKLFPKQEFLSKMNTVVMVSSIASMLDLLSVELLLNILPGPGYFGLMCQLASSISF